MTVLFQSTRPLRGATHTLTLKETRGIISIHAPLAGRDVRYCCNPTSVFYFNPRAPCGARRPLRAALGHPDCISIHAPLAGRDSGAAIAPIGCIDFNPRAPCGARRTSNSRLCERGGHFNPRAPCGARRLLLARFRQYRYFNPRAPCGARPVLYLLQFPFPSISIHAPLAGRDYGHNGRPSHQ